MALLSSIDRENRQAVINQLLELGRFKEALSETMETMRRYPKANFYKQRGRAYLGLKQYELALLDFESFLGLTDEELEEAKVLCLKAKCLAELKKCESRMLNEFRTVEFYETLALSCWRDGKIEMSRGYWDCAIALEATNPQYFYGRALVNLGLNKYQEAVDDALAAGKMGYSEPVRVYTVIVGCYQKMANACDDEGMIGYLEKARFHLEEVLRISPGHPFFEEVYRDVKLAIQRAKLRFWFKWDAGSDLIYYIHPNFRKKLGQ